MLRRRFSAFAASPIVAALVVVPILSFGCSGGGNEASNPADTGGDDTDAGPALPPRICKTPPPQSNAWFVDATADVGLAPTATLTPLASVVVSADLDDDGFADLIALDGPGDRPTKQVSFVFMNRPSPDDPTQRTFVESLASSGLQATRDGAGNRGFGLALLGDLDSDGDEDAIVCPSWVGADGKVPIDSCDAFLNDGKAHFTFAAKSDLAAKSAVTPGGSLFDYDLDGVLDFWPATIARWPYGGVPSQFPQLYRGNGDGTFTNVSTDVGLPEFSGRLDADAVSRPFFGSTACDLDGDGDDDIVDATYGRLENWVFRNDQSTFVEVGRDLGLAHDDREDYHDDQSYLCWCADPANVGAPDCTPAPPKPGMSCTVFGNPYLRGWGPQSEQSYMLGGNNFSFACNDIDDDGDMDLMSATIVHGDVGSASDPSELIINPGDGTKFQRPGNTSDGLDRPETGLYWNHGDDMAVFVDVDLDGRKDIFLTTTGAYPNSHAWVWRQTDALKFSEIGVAAGFSSKVNYHGPAFVDFDGDGDLDLVVGDTTTGAVHAFRNVVGQDSNWLRVRLVGKGAGGANRDGIGAKVTVTTGTTKHVQELQGGFGHGNVENDLVLTFGLGDACDVDAIDVRWPSATGTTHFTNVRGNYDIVLTEGDPAVKYVQQ
jgi:hypothetical protein